MATHKELAATPIDNGRHRFCLDEVVRDDEDAATSFAFVWRGNKKTPNGFIARPAYSIGGY